MRPEEEPKIETLYPDVSRRNLIGGLASIPLLKLAEGQEQSQPDRPEGMVIRQKEPENLESRFESLESFITPNDQFFVRSHFKVPKIDASEWRLKVEGAVSRPIELSLDEIRSMPSRKVTMTLECAGNSRVFLSPSVNGAQWELGAVSTAEWTGIPLGDLLKRAGISAGAVDIVLEGADSGSMKDEPTPPRPFHYSRSLPISKALDERVLLAFKMNGEDLTASHGYPLRAIVPGWYGTSSVKWLTRVLVMEKPYAGYFQTVDYAFWEDLDRLPTRTMITEMQVKSEIARPVMREVVRANSSYRMHGAAWTSGGDISRVEVSDDGGSTWKPATLIGRREPNAWRMWEFEWRTPHKAGMYTLMSKATDSRGRTQPAQHDPNHANYIIHHTLPIDVIVR